MLILGKPMEKYGITFVCHNSTASFNGRIFKNRVYNESSTFELSNSLQNICHSRAFDFRFTHSMSDTSMKKLEFPQLSSKLTKIRIQVDFKWRYTVVEWSDFKKSSFIGKFRSYTFKLLARKFSATHQWHSHGLFNGFQIFLK